MLRSLSFVIEGEVNTKITVTEDGLGGLQFDLAAMDGGVIGDLRAIFFDLNGVDVDTLSLSTEGQDVTDDAFGEEGVDTLGKDANIKGSVSNELGDFDVGVEFGTSGMSRDDIQSTSFSLSSANQSLTLDMLNLADFGIRYTSVGEVDGNRSASLKLGDTGTGVNQNDAMGVLENSEPPTPENMIDLFANDQTADAAGNSLQIAITQVDGLVEEAGFFTGNVTSDDGVDLGTLTINSVSGEASFVARADALADGESREVSVRYETTANDGSTATAFLSISVSGTNDQPIIDAGASTLIGDLTEIADLAAGENVADLTATGVIAFSDADITDTHSASFAEQAAGYRGTFSLGAPTTTDDTTSGSVGWSFTINDADLDDLAAGQTITQTYDVTIDDGTGGTATKNVTVTLTGS